VKVDGLMRSILVDAIWAEAHVAVHGPAMAVTQFALTKENPDGPDIRTFTAEEIAVGIVNAKETTAAVALTE
jgi:hypothetical protein